MAAEINNVEVNQVIGEDCIANKEDNTSCPSPTNSGADIVKRSHSKGKLPIRKKVRSNVDARRGGEEVSKTENIQGVVEADGNSTNTGDDMDGELEMEPQVSHLLNKLSSQIQHRVRAKKQRLDQNFQAVYSIPVRILTLQNEQREQRERLISDFQESLGAINDRLKEIAQVQQKTEEKHGKVEIALTKENNEVKKLVAECKDLHKTAIGKFSNADKSLMAQYEAESARDAEQHNKELQSLQRRLLADGQKEDSEVLYNMHRFI